MLHGCSALFLQIRCVPKAGPQRQMGLFLCRATFAKSLNRQGIHAAMMHGDRSRSQRTATLTGFQRGHYRVSVATDVAARGIHVQDIGHVINYDLPDVAENFVHRVGRTGGAGERGIASTFFVREQKSELFQLERTLGVRMERMLANGEASGKKECAPMPREERVRGALRPTLIRLPAEVSASQLEN